MYRIPVRAAGPDQARSLARDGYAAAGPAQRAAWCAAADKPRDFVVRDPDGAEIDD